MQLEVFWRKNPPRQRSFPGCPREWSCLSRSPACRTCRGRCPSAPCRSIRRPGNRRTNWESDQEDGNTKHQAGFQTDRKPQIFQCFSGSEEILNIHSLLQEVICIRKSSDMFVMIGLCLPAHAGGSSFTARQQWIQDWTKA